MGQRMDKLYKSQPMHVGPFAQALIGHAQGHKLTLKWAGEAISRVSAISKKQVTPAMLHSTLGRTAARAIRASMLTDLADKHWDLLLKNIASGERPLEVLRTGHSFACLACAIYTFDPDGKEVISVS
jgi:hydrogenase large subunit